MEKSLNGTRTEQNLLKSFAGDYQVATLDIEFSEESCSKI
jgi:hypothetical protein